MEYFLIPINDTNTLINGKRLKDMLYEKFPEIGNLEITKVSKVLINNNEEKKTKIENKSDKKLDKLFNKLNIPKYILCQKYNDGSYCEMETGEEITVKDSEAIQKFKFDFQTCYEYWFGSLYEEKIANFFKKESELIKYEQKEAVKAKKKTKKKNS
ncbi:MAG: hypothetical protein K6E99_02400 [Bacilli bacterium]|nr:hypothetical protein [Bacilli bacterium]